MQNIGIIGLGAASNRQLQAIAAVASARLVAAADIDAEKLARDSSNTAVGAMPITASWWQTKRWTSW